MGRISFRFRRSSHRPLTPPLLQVRIPIPHQLEVRPCHRPQIERSGRARGEGEKRSQRESLTRLASLLYQYLYRLSYIDADYSSTLIHCTSSYPLSGATEGSELASESLYASARTHENITRNEANDLLLSSTLSLILLDTRKVSSCPPSGPCNVLWHSSEKQRWRRTRYDSTASQESLSLTKRFRQVSF